MRKKLTAVISAAVLVMSGCSAEMPINTAPPEEISADELNTVSNLHFSITVPTPVPTSTPGVTMVALLDLNELKAEIEEEIASTDGVWSVYVKDINGGDEIVINDAPMKAASVMKLFIMGTVFDEIQSGFFQYSEVEGDMYYMITESSNENANDLLYALGSGSYAEGIAKVNAFAEKYGYNKYTVEYNGFDDPNTIVGGNFNVTSALDCGSMLEAIYRGECVSPEMSAKMLELLKGQRTDYKLVYTLPDYAVVANKSGEMDTVENDVGIVYSPERDYIICVLSNDWSDNADAIETIQDISQTTYEFFNPHDPNYVSVKVGQGGQIEEIEPSEAQIKTSESAETEIQTNEGGSVEMVVEHEEK